MSPTATRPKTATRSKLEQVFREELDRIQRKTADRQRQFEQERLEHLRECVDDTCSSCRLYEVSEPELVARVRAQRRLRRRRNS